MRHPYAGPCSALCSLAVRWVPLCLLAVRCAPLSSLRCAPLQCAPLRFVALRFVAVLITSSGHADPALQATSMDRDINRWLADNGVRCVRVCVCLLSPLCSVFMR